MPVSCKLTVNLSLPSFTVSLVPSPLRHFGILGIYFSVAHSKNLQLQLPIYALESTECASSFGFAHYITTAIFRLAIASVGWSFYKHLTELDVSSRVVKLTAEHQGLAKAVCGGRHCYHHSCFMFHQIVVHHEECDKLRWFWLAAGASYSSGH